MMDRNAASSRMDHGAESARAEWLSAMQSLAEQIQKQQQTSQQMAQQWMEQAQQQRQTFQQQAQEQQQSFQQMTQEVMSTYSQLFNIPFSYAQQSLRDAQFPIEGYDELTVEEVSAHLDALSTEELREVRDYEERTKN